VRVAGEVLVDACVVMASQSTEPIHPNEQWWRMCMREALGGMGQLDVPSACFLTRPHRPNPTDCVADRLDARPIGRKTRPNEHQQRQNESRLRR
jgi:hypothetical protein